MITDKKLPNKQQNDRSSRKAQCVKAHFLGSIFVYVIFTCNVCRVVARPTQVFAHEPIEVSSHHQKIVEPQSSWLKQNISVQAQLVPINLQPQLAPLQAFRNSPNGLMATTTTQSAIFHHQQPVHQQQARWQPQPLPYLMSQNAYNLSGGEQNEHQLRYLPHQAQPMLSLASNGYVSVDNRSSIGITMQQEQPQQQQMERNTLHKALMGLQNPRLLGGDILLKMTPLHRRPTVASGRVYKYERSALVSPISLWPDALIYFELDPSVAHLTELIYKVMDQFHENTCIRFIARESNEPDYLRIEARRGCFSYIGRIGGEQILSLGDGCEYRGTIAHELLHAVGFYHHQNRSDRDEFLEILWDNIAKGKDSQFRKMDPSENILLNQFDYNSIMLYGPHTFGKTLDKITMKPKREGVILLEVIEKQGLSALDIDSVNKLYKCYPSSIE